MKNSKLKFNGGQAMMVATMFFLAISLTVIFGLVGPIVRQQKMTTQALLSRQSYFLAEAGVEDVVLRLFRGEPVDLSETITLNGSSATIVTTDVLGGKEIVASGEVQQSVRKVATRLQVGDGIAFSFGVQVGAGGFELDNNAGVNGNVYSNSTIVGANGAFITGSASAVTSITSVIVGTSTTGDVNAPTVTNSTVRGALYCKSGSGNNKACNTSAQNPTAETFPISDAQITEWKNEALAGGTIGSQNYSGTNTTLGPKKIDGNLTLTNSAILTLSGVLWVTGNITLSNNASLRLAAFYGSNDGLVIADGTILLDNGSSFEGSGTAGSHIMLLTTSNSLSAIKLSNNADAAVLYAQNGTIQLDNNTTVKQLTAKTISLSNNAVLDYEQGLINSAFVSGPSGGYEIQSWKEVE